jgi:hypothetical protein
VKQSAEQKFPVQYVTWLFQVHFGEAVLDKVRLCRRYHLTGSAHASPSIVLLVGTL